RYALQVLQQKDRLVFEFRDGNGRSGTLSLQLPALIPIFEVDPREDARDGGAGPRLYKEWKLTSKAAGTDVFGAGMGSNQTITLVLHGHGNSCTSAQDFTHWTLMIDGPKARYSLFGEFEPPQ